MTGTTRPVGVHYLRHNAAERSPRRLLVLDTESHQEPGPLGSRHTLRCWVLGQIERDKLSGPDATVPTVEGERGDALAAAVTDYTRTRHTTWLYAHNLGFDVTLSGLLDGLAGLGWVVNASALASGTPWVRLSRGSKRLVLADSVSLFPTSIETLGRSYGMGKAPLPHESGNLSDWLARCRSDVAILARALLDVLDWWQEGKMGCWTTTGAALGWNHYRHSHTPAKVVINPDPVARAVERRAITSGYRFQWRHGMMGNEWVADIDLSHAHLTVAATHNLPRQRCPLPSWVADDPRRYCNENIGTLAWCRVETEQPRYPLRLDSEVWYPVGEFWSLLAGPEMRAAAERGELREIGHGYAYKLSPVMRRWARWLIDELDLPAVDASPAVWWLEKGWSRSVIGKWAGRTSRLDKRWQGQPEGTEIRLGRDLGSGERIALVQSGGRLDKLVLDQESDNSFPAVLAWVQSWTRVYLWRLLDALGGAVLSANTDGVLVSLERIRAGNEAFWGPDLGNGEPYLSIAAALPGMFDPVVAPLALKVKRISRGAQILSPAHIIFDRERVLAGVPRDAVTLGPLRYGFQTWPKLPQQLAPGHAEGFQQHGREIDLSGLQPQGWKWQNGTVTPVRVKLDRDDQPSIMGVPGVWPTGAPPAAVTEQRPRLRSLLAGQS